VTIQQAQTQPTAIDDLADVSETGVLTLFCRAIESLSPQPILKDEKAVQIMRELAPQMTSSPHALMRELSRGRPPGGQRMIVHIALRAQKYDQYTLDFLARNPDGVVVNLGCGFDTRFFRIDNGQVVFFDLDLPDVIRIKKHLLQEQERYQMISSSVLDYGWMDRIQERQRPVLFLAEGLFMYLEGDKVKDLILTIQARFPGSELVCEVVNERWLKGMAGMILWSKLRKEAKLGSNAGFQFGIPDGRALESWGPGIKFLDEWSYFDSMHPKLGMLKWIGQLPLFHKVQWTVHYRLN
jgi:methyltransferase (TIGR00027 family)